MRFALRCALALIAVLPGSSCGPSEQQVFRDYLYNSYYSTLAKERGDILTEFATLAGTVDYANPPSTPDVQYKMIPIIEKWVKSRQHFDDVTAKDDSDPRIKPIRDKYREADNVWTFALTEWFSWADPAQPGSKRRALLESYAGAYKQGLDLLTQAHDMVQKAME